MTEQETEKKIRTAFSHAAPDTLDQILSACTPFNNGIVRASARETRGGFAQIILDVNPSISLAVDDKEIISRAVALNEDGEKILADLSLEGRLLSAAVEAVTASLVAAGYVSADQNTVLVTIADADAEKETELQDKVSQIIARTIREDLKDTGTDASVIAQPADAGDAGLIRLAAAYGISLGKAALIRRMTDKEGAAMEDMEQNNEQQKEQQKETRQFDDLASASVNDIALLADEDPIQDDTVTRIGRASDRAYIGHKGALEAALTYAGLTMKQVKKQKIKIGRRKGRMIYKVKIKGRGGKYKYELDGRTGEMVRCKKNGKKTKQYKKYYKKMGKKYKITYRKGGTIMNMMNNDPNNANAQIPMPEGAISEQEAKEAALNHAGVKESDTQYVYVHPEIDHGQVEHYDVKFVAGGMKYKYAIGLYDGAVLGRGVKDKVHKGKYVYEGNYHEHVAPPMGTVSQTAPVTDTTPTADAAPQAAAPAQAAAPTQAATPENPTGDMLSEGDALNIALNYAGLTMGDLIRWKVKLRTKHGRTVYRIKLKVQGYEYEIDVDAYTQSITKAHKEVDF